MATIKPQGEKLITFDSLFGKLTPNRTNMGGFVDESGRLFYDDGTMFSMMGPTDDPDQQYRFDVSNPIKTKSGNVYKDPMGSFVSTDPTNKMWGGSEGYIGSKGLPVTPNEKGEITDQAVYYSANPEKMPRVYPDETSPTGYALMTEEQRRQYSANDWNAFINSGKTFGTPVLKDGTPYEKGMSILPAGTDVNRLQQVLQEMTNLEVTGSTTGSPLQGGANAQRMNDLRNEVTALTGGDINFTNALVNQLSYRPAQQQVQQILEASRNPDTSFSLKNITNAAGRLVESVGPAIAAMAVAQYALPSLLGSPAAAFTGATETGLATLAGEGALADTVGATLLAGGQGAASAPSFTSNAMLANLGLGAEAATPFTSAPGLSSGLFSTIPSSSGFVGLTPEYAAELGLSGGSGLGTAGASGNVLVGLPGLSEGFVGLSPEYAAELGLEGGSGLSTQGMAGDPLANLYGLEGMPSSYPGDSQYIEQDLMEQARATNVPSGSPTSWDTGISAAITPGQALMGARLASGLLSSGQEKPQVPIQTGGMQTRLPQGAVDYSGIYNLLSLQRPQNRYSLLG